MILGEDSEKMSKSRGNVVSPDALVEQHGADAVRAYLMFFARWEQGAPWSFAGIEGTARWLRRIVGAGARPEPRRGRRRRQPARRRPTRRCCAPCAARCTRRSSR